MVTNSICFRKWSPDLTAALSDKDKKAMKTKRKLAQKRMREAVILHGAHLAELHSAGAPTCSLVGRWPRKHNER